MTSAITFAGRAGQQASARLAVLLVVGTCLSCGDEPGPSELSPGPALSAMDPQPPNGPPVTQPGPVPMAGVGAPPPAPSGPAPIESPMPMDGPPMDDATPGVPPDAGVGPEKEPDAGMQPDGQPDAGQPPVEEVCPLPKTYRWTSGGPIAQPKNGALALKDFTHVYHDGKHIIYMTTSNGNWGSGMFMFEDWADAGSAQQLPTRFGVAPTLLYFAPKDIWVLAYQWGSYKFSYRTSSDPTDPNSWSSEHSLYNTPLPPNGTGPIDQTLICDSERCYLYYAGDNGHIYKSSMPIGDFPGQFAGAQDSGIQGTTQNLFEGVQVYSIKGSDEYLMLVEAQSGSGRYYRAWTASDLDGPWQLLTDEFARKSNVDFSQSWTNDISHGDLIRSSPDETMPIDPCNLQFLFQGRDPNINTSYSRLPYRPGLLRFVN